MSWKDSIIAALKVTGVLFLAVTSVMAVFALLIATGHGMVAFVLGLGLYAYISRN